jgi:uncharacterized protein (TIGR02147 family)
MDSIYKYTEYRLYLKDYFTLKKSKNSGFSLKVLSDKAGFKARDFLLRVMNGTRNLSQSGALMLSKSLQLTEKEEEYFVNLVGFNQAKTIAEKDHYFKKLSSVCPNHREQKIKEDEYEYFSEWYHAAIRSLLPVIDFKDDFVKLGKTLDPPISAAQVRKSIDLLQRFGFLIRTNNGNYQATTPSLSTGEEIRSFGLVQFQKKCLELASRALEKLPAQERDFSGVTMSISDRAFATIKEEIRTFRQKVASIAMKDANEDRAYQLCIQFFPLSRKSNSI